MALNSGAFFIVVRSAVLIFLAVLCATPFDAQAVTRTWDNGSFDGLWSTCTNWSADTCPTSADTASFDSSTTSNATIDAAFTGTVDAMSIASGYTGKITFARSLTIDNSGGYSQADGLVDIEGFNISLTGDGGMSITGGAFHGTTTTLTMDRNFTVSGSGSILLSTATTTLQGGNTADDSTLTCTGTFPGVINVAKTGLTSDFTLASGCAATLANTITTSGGLIFTGDITTGSFIIVSPGSNGSANFTNSGAFISTALQSISLSGNMTINANLANFNVPTTFTGSFTGDDTTLTCTGTYPGTITIAKTSVDGAFTQAAGCTITLATSISTAGPVTFNGDVTTGTSFAITASNSNPLFTNAGTLNAASLTSFTTTGGFTNTGTLSSYTATTTFNGGNTANDSTLTCTGSFPGKVDIAKTSSGADFTLASGCNIQLVKAVATDGAMTFTGDVTTGETITINAGNNASVTLTVNGAFTSTALTALSLSGNLTINASLSSFTAPTTFTGSQSGDDSTLTCTGTYPGTVNISKTSESASFTLAVGCNITLATAVSTAGAITFNGDVTTGTSIAITSGSSAQLFTNAGTLNAAALTSLTTTGSVTNTGTLSSFTATTTFNGSNTNNDSTLTCTGTWPAIVDVSKVIGADFALASGCAATLANTLTTAGSLTFTGDVTTGSFITINGSGGVPVLTNNGTFTSTALISLTLSGSLTVNASLSTFTATTTFTGTNSNNDGVMTCTGTYPGPITVTKSNSGSDFTLASGCTATLSTHTTPAGAVIINGTLDTRFFNLNSTGAAITVGSAGTIKLTGNNSTFEIPTLSSGSTVEYTGTTTGMTLKAGTSYSNIKFTGSGTWSTTTALTITDNFEQTAGTFTTTGTTTFSGSSSATATSSSGTTWGHINIQKTSAAVTLGGNLVATGNLFINSGTLDASASNCSSASCAITIGKNWSKSGTFTPQTGTVTLNGSNQQIASSTTFYNLTKSTASTDTLSFQAGSTQTVSNTLTLNGASGAILSLRSSSSGSAWDIDPQGSRSVSYLSVQDSNNTNASAINATDGTSSGVSGNTNWNFGQPTVSSLGPTAVVNGSTGADTSPDFTFTTADGDSDDIAFQIQISTDSGFSSNTVDYTSAYAAVGAATFTVGQAAGSGAYTDGSSGQTLSDANYYWRVRVGDGMATSSYETANSGAVAFIVDAVSDSSGTLGGGIFGGGGGGAQIPLPSCTLAFSPSVVKLHLPTILSWSGIQTTNGAINNGIGIVSATGTRVIIPPPPGIGTLVYTATFNATNGTTVICSASLTVQGEGKAPPKKEDKPKTPPPPAPPPPPPPAPEPEPEPIPEPAPAPVPEPIPEPPPPPPPSPEPTAENPILINDGEQAAEGRYIPVEFIPPPEAVQIVIFELGNPEEAVMLAPEEDLTFDLCEGHVFCPNGAYAVGAYFIMKDGSHGEIELADIVLDSSLFLSPSLGEFIESEEVHTTAKASGITVGTVGIAWTLFSGGHALSELPLLLWRSLMSLFLVGYREKRRRRWGTVYDSVTKRPLDPAIVTLYRENGTQVGSAITDLDGRYGFLVERGRYFLKAEKSYHTFPSTKVPAIDPPYDTPYKGELIEVSEGGVVMKDIPLDPTAFDWNEYEKYRRGLYRFFSALDRPLAYLSFILVPAGFFFSIWSFVANPTTFDLAMVGLYFLIGLLFMGGLGPRLYGMIKTTYGTPLPFARLEAYSHETKSSVGHAVADHLGRYYLLLPRGDFTLTVTTPQTPEPVAKQEIHAPRGHYNKKIVVEE